MNTDTNFEMAKCNFASEVYSDIVRFYDVADDKFLAIRHLANILYKPSESRYNEINNDFNDKLRFIINGQLDKNSIIKCITGYIHGRFCNTIIDELLEYRERYHKYK